MRGLEREGRVLIMHTGEPRACWLPLDPKSPHYAYYSEHPQWHMHGRTDFPSHAELIAGRDRVLERHPRVAVCTIYNGNLDESEAGPARVALMLFNDAILRVAFELGLDVIDLRLVCTERDDYANAIEPSGKGGRKVARAIARALGALEEGGSRSRVYAG